MSNKKLDSMTDDEIAKKLGDLEVEEVEYLHQRGRITDEQRGEVIDEDEYSGWKKAELMKELEDRGLDTTGTKSELVARLEEDDASD